jgi:membrane protein implicated in regulation of membrane protease activity
MIGVELIPWMWAFAALLLAFIELNAPGYYLIWIACAAALTSVIAFSFDVSVTGQVIIFAFSSMLICAVGHFVYRRLLPSEHDSSISTINRPDADLVGAVGVASESFRSGVGKVRLGDTYWLAESSDEIGKGVPIVVRAVRGISLVVAARK